MRKKVFWTIGVLAVVAVVAGLLVFEPWRAFTSSEAHDPSPQAAAAGGPKALAEGRFVGQEHETSGVAKIVEDAEGRRVLRFERLAGSDGPDLHVWLTDRKAGLEDWGAYDDGRYVSLGELKATHGEQNYRIPADVRLDDLRSVVIWCDRFNVAFGSAPIE